MKRQETNNIYNFFIKAMLCSIVFLILGILCKININYKEKIHYYLYEDTLNFGYVINFYNNYLGGLSLFNDNTKKTEEVFKEKIKYSKIEEYEQGGKIFVDNNYLVPPLKTGTVIYIGNSDKYGTVVTVKDTDGIDTLYGNICNSSLKIYDFLSSDSYIGESCSNYIYIVFSKDGSNLSFNKYFEY